MDKDAYWFPHDSNARNDPKMCRLLMNGGQEAKGCYWDMIEILRDAPGYRVAVDELTAIEFANHFTEGVIEHILECELLVIEDDYIFSPSLLRRMERMDTIREKRAVSGRLGGKAKAKNIASARQVPSKAKAKLKQSLASTGQDRTVQDRIGEDRTGEEPEKSVRKRTVYSHEFETFWKAYPRGTNKVGAYKAWGKVQRPPLDELLSAIEVQKNTEQWKKNVIPHAATWLNAARWEDEVKQEGDGYKNLLAQYEEEEAANE